MNRLDIRKAMEKRNEQLPKEIRERKREIWAKTQEAVVDAEKKGRIDYGRVQEIVNLKLQLDGAYVDWGNR